MWPITLRKTQWLVVTPLTFGNPLKFGPDSCHKTKGRPTFLHRKREHPKLCASTQHHIYWEGPRQAVEQGPAMTAAIFPLPFRLRPDVNTTKKDKVLVRNLRVRSGEKALLLGSLGLLGWRSREIMKKEEDKQNIKDKTVHKMWWNHESKKWEV